MLTDYNLKLPKYIYGGEAALEKIPEIVGQRKKIAVFTDKGIVSAGLTRLPIELIQKTDAEFKVFDELAAEPSCDQAQKVVDDYRDFGAELIIAIGGGSVMDMAKLASILTTGEHSVRDLLENPMAGKKSVPTLMIPTTAGTGAEATPNSIVLVPEKDLKVGIVNPEMIADYVILDARMIAKLPRKIAAATGVDALAHAIECFTSKKANPFSDTFALEALDLIVNNIERACDDENALAEKRNMLIAAFYAGIAITASGTTAVHALSYPLGGKYHIPHGVSNAMLLVPVMRFNLPFCKEKLARAYSRVSPADSASLTEDERAERMVGILDRIVKHLDIPTGLKEYGVPAEDLEILVESGLEVRRLLDNNMRPVTAEDARAIYSMLLE